MTTIPTRAHRSNLSKLGSDRRTAETIPKTRAGKMKKEVTWVRRCRRQSLARAYTE